MRSVLLATLGVSALLSGENVLAAPVPPLMTVVIKPGLVDTVAGKGDVDVALTIPEVDAPAGVNLITLGTQVQGMAEPLKVSDLTVSDAQGPVPVTNRGRAGSLQMAPDRAVKGELNVSYRLHVVNVPIPVGRGRRFSRVSTAMGSPAKAAG